MTDEQMLLTMELWGWVHQGRTFTKALPGGEVAIISVNHGNVSIYDVNMLIGSLTPADLWEPINVFYRIAENYELGRKESIWS